MQTEEHTSELQSYNEKTIKKKTEDIYEEMANKFMVPIEGIKKRFEELNMKNDIIKLV